MPIEEEDWDYDDLGYDPDWEDEEEQEYPDLPWMENY